MCGFIKHGFVWKNVGESGNLVANAGVQIPTTTDGQQKMTVTCLDKYYIIKQMLTNSLALYYTWLL